MKKVLIIGANRGIGLALAEKFKKEGFEVLATCRNPSKELQALEVQVFEGVEVTSDSSLKALAEELPQLNLCVYNAGILRSDSLDGLESDFDFSSIEEQFKVNALAPLKTAVALSPKIKNGGKIFFMTSRMGSLSDNTSGGSYGYRSSKAALNMFGRSLSVDLKEREISVGLLHPGWVRTRMTGDKGLIDVQESAEGLFQKMEEMTLEKTGTFWHTNGEELSW